MSIKSLIFSVVTFVILFAVYVGLFYYQLNASQKEKCWACEKKVVKHHLANKNMGRRILIAGGSSSLFGIDSSYIELSTAISTFNLSLVIDWPFEHMVSDLIDISKSNDIIIFPVEYELYSREDAGDWFLLNILPWASDYIYKKNIFNQFKFILEVPPYRVISGVLSAAQEKKSMFDKQIVYRRKQKVLQEFYDHLDLEAISDDVYSVRNLDLRGDITDYPALEKVEKKMKPYNFSPLSEYFNIHVSKLIEYCKKNNITLIFTWPPVNQSLVNNIYDITSQYQDFYQKKNVLVAGDPVDYLYSDRYFYDTNYHLNESGKKLRTKILERQLTNILKTINKDVE